MRQAEAEAKAKVAEAKVQRTFSPSLHRARQGNTNNGNFVRNNFVHERRSWTRSPPNGASKFSNLLVVSVESRVIRRIFVGQDCSQISAVSVFASRDFDLFQESFAKDPDVGTFRPFLSQGTVEVDGVETPVTILRDSGCLQTLIKEGVVAARKTDKYVVLGSLWSQGAAPLYLSSLLVARVDLTLCNDLAGGQMGNVTPPPVLRERPESTAELQQLEDDMPGVFPLCAVTRSIPIASQDISSAVNAVTGRVALIAAQEQDDSLRISFDQESDSANDSGPTTRYF
ncbi:hypothetical protein Hamer_G030069, partial [Homarus americanus]